MRQLAAIFALAFCTVHPAFALSSLSFTKDFGVRMIMAHCSPAAVPCERSATSCLSGCAVTSGARVGLDVELLGRKTRATKAKLMRKFLAPAEIARLEGWSPHC